MGICGEQPLAKEDNYFVIYTHLQTHINVCMYLLCFVTFFDNNKWKREEWMATEW